MTNARTPAHPEPSAAGGRVEGPTAFRRALLPARPEALEGRAEQPRLAVALGALP